jgi:hypothetical protein
MMRRQLQSSWRSKSIEQRDLDALSIIRPQGDAKRGTLFAPNTLHREAASPLLLEQSASDTYALNIHPSLVEIEYVRIEQRGENILHHHRQSDPCY